MIWNNKCLGRVARDELLKSRLTNNILGKIWRWEDCIEINSYIVNTNTSLTKSELSNKRTMWKDPPNQITIFTLFRLADTDADGLLDDEEFALAQHLIKVTIRVCTFCNSAFPLACLHFFIVLNYYFLLLWLKIIYKSIIYLYIYFCMICYLFYNKKYNL